MPTKLSGPPPVEQLLRFDAVAVRASVDLLDRASPADLARPTPCAGWTLLDLLGHLTAAHHGFAAASRGDGDPARWRPGRPGDDPIAEYAAAADHVLSAFAEEGVPTRVFPLPELGAGATFPAGRAISFHFVDYVVHSWDIARALGRAVHFGQPLLDAALAVARAVPGGEARLRPGASFGPEVSSSSESTLDRIVALLGRSPTWPERSPA